MKVISQNLGFKNKDFLKAARNGDKATMSVMAEVMKKAGADILNISFSLDGDGDEKYMEQAVVAAQRAGLPLSIDSRNPKAQLAAVKAAEVPVIINYVCAEESRRKEMDEIIGIAADNKTDLVLYALRKGTPADADERLEIIQSLIEKANAAGIPSERLIVDPVILHIGGGIGQEHAVAVQETLFSELQHRVVKLALLYTFEDYEAAQRSAQRAETIIHDDFKGTIWDALRVFYHALTLTALHPSTPADAGAARPAGSGS